MKTETVLITGSSRGIGRAIALAFAREGKNVFLNCVERSDKMEEVLKDIKALGGRGKGLKCDISDYAGASKLVSSVCEEYGGIDILINNAGISHIGLFQDMTEEEYRRLINVNLLGTLNVTHAVLPYMIKTKKGAIINISSVWGNKGSSCEAVYSASKGGINSFTQALAKELGPSGIRVNAISPGCIDTEMNAALSSADKAALCDDIPLMRFGRPEEIAKTALFLASDSASYINGQIITVDGGFL